VERTTGFEPATPTLGRRVAAQGGAPGLRRTIIIGLFLSVGSVEFVGRFDEQGWRFAGVIVPITYVAWSLWLILSGVVLVIA